MFYVMYRWTIRAGHEAAFEAAWAELTHYIRAERGGLGSRLHRAEGGAYVGYARWPNEETWRRAFAKPLPESAASRAMAAAVLDRDAPLPLTLVEDLIS